MKSTADRMKILGESLFGPGWIAPTCRLIGEHRTTVRRCLDGRTDGKPEWIDKLALAARGKRNELGWALSRSGYYVNPAGYKPRG